MLRTSFLVMAVMMAAQSPRGTAMIELNGGSAAIEYGRPTLDGRDVVELAPKGTIWRLGADQATSFAVEGVAVFGNLVVPEGTYSLFLSRVSDVDWALVVNRQTGQWGTEHNPREDIMSVPLKWEKLEDSVEQLTISFQPETDETAILTIRWGIHSLKQRLRITTVE